MLKLGVNLPTNGVGSKAVVQKLCLVIFPAQFLDPLLLISSKREDSGGPRISQTPNLGANLLFAIFSEN